MEYPDKELSVRQRNIIFNKVWNNLEKEEQDEAKDEAIKIICEKWEDESELNSSVVVDGVKMLRRFSHYGDESTHYVYNKYRNQLIADIARKKNKRTLIIFSKIAHGEELQKLLPEAILIHGEHSLNERNEAERYLKENEHAIVLSSNIWSTGKDIPEIEIFINAGAGVSKIQQIQKMGRATRLSPSTGKDEAVVIDFIDAFSPIGIKQSNKRKNVYKNLNIEVKIIGE
ncbi:MAG: type I restriction enzyme EcoKI subunit R [candidate division CPR1 bacterium ADurb.Bin160]|uniref:Type I restriction enzyme EcoKI subunit R n=1 Tax=candidate division CPR1 bacterium ADurb.Bin160 TaxID=1852826 RepID=A0A1V5ZIE9_9BACT|nr:MAG: type I restriction enzyme EcoKI subunit R [candidate division CPR1 bacterium ADurb.Bin160]